MEKVLLFLMRQLLALVSALAGWVLYCAFVLICFIILYNKYLKYL